MKSKAKVLIPILVIAAYLVYCWITILFTDRIAGLRHYLGLALFIPLLPIFFKNLKMSLWATAVYLLIGTFNGLAFTADISTVTLQLGAITTPRLQMLSFGFLFLFFIINNAVLIDAYLDYKQAKRKQISEGTR